MVTCELSLVVVLALAAVGVQREAAKRKTEGGYVGRVIAVRVRDESYTYTDGEDVGKKQRQENNPGLWAGFGPPVARQQPKSLKIISFLARRRIRVLKMSPLGASWGHLVAKAGTCSKVRRRRRA